MQLLVPMGSGSVCELRARVGDAFFHPGGADWGVLGADLQVDLRVRGEGDRSFVDVRLEGHVRVECDRCLAPFDCPLAFSDRLELRRGAGRAVEEEGDVWLVPRDMEQLDVAPYVRESVYLSLPMRRYHGMAGTDAGACDAAMCAYIATEAAEGHGAMGAQLGELLERMNARPGGRETD